MTASKKSYPGVSPYLTVRDADTAIAFYQAAFGATEEFRLSDPSTGRIGHADIMIEGSHIMLSDENPAWGNKSPETLSGSPVALCLNVANADETVARAAAAGATVDMPPTDMFYGFRSAAIRDPFGHKWLIQHEIEEVAHDEMQRRWEAMLQGGAECPAAKE